jgi:hypothetical protein
MTQRQLDPETEFGREIHSLLLSAVALLERTKLRNVIKIKTADLRQAEKDRRRGGGP